MEPLAKPADADPAGTTTADPNDRYWRGIPKVTWLFLGYFLVVLVIGIIALASLADDVSASAVLALVGTVFGAVSTHLAHTAGHQFAKER